MYVHQFFVSLFTLSTPHRYNFRILCPMNIILVPLNSSRSASSNYMQHLLLHLKRAKLTLILKRKYRMVKKGETRLREIDLWTLTSNEHMP